MTRVILDATTASQVRSNGDDIELCDENGTVLGRYRRAAERQPVEEWASEAEIKRIRSDPRPRLTPEQVMEHLRG